MSYVRWGEEGSDVYVWAGSGASRERFAPAIRWYIVCQECLLMPEMVGDADEFSKRARENFRADSRTVMLAHLTEHQKAGHTVGARAIERLKEEIADE